MKTRDLVIAIIVIIFIILGIITGSIFSKDDSGKEITLNENPFGPPSGDADLNNDSDKNDDYSSFLNAPFNGSASSATDIDDTYDDDYDAYTTTQRVYNTSNDTSVSEVYYYDDSNYDDFYSDDTPSTTTTVQYDGGMYDYDLTDGDYDYDSDNGDYDDYNNEDDDVEDYEELDGCSVVNLLADTLGISTEEAKIIVMLNPDLLLMCITQSTAGIPAGDEEKGY